MTKQDLATIFGAASSVAELINTRHEIAKARGWKVKPPSKSELMRAALEDPNVLRRPILIGAKGTVIGKDEEALRKLLGVDRPGPAGAGTC